MAEDFTKKRFQMCKHSKIIEGKQFTQRDQRYDFRNSEGVSFIELCWRPAGCRRKSDLRLRGGSASVRWKTVCGDDATGTFKCSVTLNAVGAARRGAGTARMRISSS